MVKSIIIRALITALAFGLGWALSAQRPSGPAGLGTAPPGTVPTAASSSKRTSARAGAPGSWGPQAILLSDSMWRSLDFQIGGRTLSVDTTEFDPQTGLPADSSFSYSTSYDILRYTHLDPSRFYLLGQARNGELVIEEFDVPAQTGGFVAGTPFTGPGSISVSGGTWIAPQSRAAPPPPTRNEIWRGSSLGTVLDLRVDPDGQFLLLLTEREMRRVERMDLADPDNPVELASEVTIPSLAALDTITCREHVSEGRLYILTAGGGPWVDQVVLLRGLEDGLLDGFDEMTRTAYEAAYPPSVWLPGYVNYLTQ